MDICLLYTSFKELDTFTEWSHNLYIPWVYMLETELKDTDHKLVPVSYTHLDVYKRQDQG